MSERTKTLENAASRALLDFVQDPSTAKADSADNVIWRISESIIAKINENFTGEIDGVRRLVNARKGETTHQAVKRVVRDGAGIAKKYKRAKEAFESERERTSDVIEAAWEYFDSLKDGHECLHRLACPRCKLLNALNRLEEDGE